MNDQGKNTANKDCLPDSSNGPLLELANVSKAFGGVQALNDITFDVPTGIILGVIGPNGAGKTTLFNVITGAYGADSGSVRFSGKEIRGKKVHKIVTQGIARTFQNVELFESMTVAENVMVGCHVRGRCGFLDAIIKTPRAKREEQWIMKRSSELLDFVGLSSQAGQRSGDLPFGWQRLLEIARALASEPSVLLLDEPAAGLNATETRQLGSLIQKIRSNGVTVLLVEHDMSLTMTISDMIIVLDRGSLLAKGTPREIQSNEAVMTAYLGKGK